jgi:hypothetical protein
VSKLLWAELSEGMDDQAVDEAIQQILTVGRVEVVHDMELDPDMEFDLEDIEAVGEEVCLNILTPVLQ